MSSLNESGSESKSGSESEDEVDRTRAVYKFRLAVAFWGFESLFVADKALYEHAIGHNVSTRGDYHFVLNEGNCWEVSDEPVAIAALEYDLPVGVDVLHEFEEGLLDGAYDDCSCASCKSFYAEQAKTAETKE